LESNYSSCIGRSSENICSSSGGAHEKAKRGWNSVYHKKLVEKLVWVLPSYFCFVKFHSQLSIWCPYYAKTGRSRPLIAWPNDMGQILRCQEKAGKTPKEQRSTILFCYFELSTWHSPQWGNYLDLGDWMSLNVLLTSLKCQDVFLVHFSHLIGSLKFVFLILTFILKVFSTQVCLALFVWVPKKFVGT
jgi:hypothetical protein